MLGWKIWPMIEDSLFFFLVKEKHTKRVGKRGSCKRRKIVRVERVLQKGLYRLSCMYVGFNGKICIRTWVVVGTIL
jgi:hypothetical protein